MGNSKLYERYADQFSNSELNLTQAKDGTSLSCPFNPISSNQNFFMRSKFTDTYENTFKDFPSYCHLHLVKTLHKFEQAHQFNAE